MGLFKKIKENQQKSTGNINNIVNPEGLIGKQKDKKIKKKKKIGFRHKKTESSENKTIIKEEPNIQKIETEIKPFEEKPSIKIENQVEPEIVENEILEEVTSEKIEKENQKTDKKQWSDSKKRKIIIPKDVKGKTVFLEDTGEKLGQVFDIIVDGEKNLVGYKIKDEKSESVMSFPIDQFDEYKDGLIFVQSWYTNSLKTLEKLEFKERVSPELTTLISDDEISNEDLYNIFVKHDDQMVNYIDEAVTLKGLLNQRLEVLEKQRLSLKDSLMDLTEKRLIKDIDRREFSELISNHRRKVNVLDVNIKKCKDLLRRLDATSFGKLSKQIINKSAENADSKIIEPPKKTKDNANLITAEEIENPYKQKYDDMKERFEQLLEEYDELKSAVEKLINKDE